MSSYSIVYDEERWEEYIMELRETVERSVQIRKLYHRLAEPYHGTKWPVEEMHWPF